MAALAYTQDEIVEYYSNTSSAYLSELDLPGYWVPASIDYFRVMLVQSDSYRYERYPSAEEEDAVELVYSGEKLVGFVLSGAGHAYQKMTAIVQDE